MRPSLHRREARTVPRRGRRAFVCQAAEFQIIEKSVPNGRPKASSVPWLVVRASAMTITVVAGIIDAVARTLAGQPLSGRDRLDHFGGQRRGG